MSCDLLKWLLCFKFINSVAQHRWCIHLCHIWHQCVSLPLSRTITCLAATYGKCLVLSARAGIWHYYSFAYITWSDRLVYLLTYRHNVHSCMPILVKCQMQSGSACFTSFCKPYYTHLYSNTPSSLTNGNSDFSADCTIKDATLHCHSIVRCCDIQYGDDGWVWAKSTVWRYDPFNTIIQSLSKRTGGTNETREAWKYPPKEWWCPCFSTGKCQVISRTCSLISKAQGNWGR